MAIQSINPATGQLVQEYTSHSAAEVQTKIAETHQTWGAWRTSTFSERSTLMKRMSGVLLQRKEELAKLMTLEMGKPISQGRAEIEKCAAVCDYYAENAEAYLKEVTVQTDASKSFISYQPIG